MHVFEYRRVLHSVTLRCEKPDLSFGQAADQADIDLKARVGTCTRLYARAQTQGLLPVADSHDGAAAPAALQKLALRIRLGIQPLIWTTEAIV